MQYHPLKRTHVDASEGDHETAKGKPTNGSSPLEAWDTKGLVAGVVRRAESRVIGVELEQLGSVVSQCSSSDARATPSLDERSINHLRGEANLGRKNSACCSN